MLGEALATTGALFAPLMAATTLMMTRGALKSVVPISVLMRALVPFLAAQLVVLGLTLAVPRLVHVLEPENSRSRNPVAKTPGTLPPPQIKLPSLPFPTGPGGPFGAPPK